MFRSIFRGKTEARKLSHSNTTAANGAVAAQVFVVDDVVPETKPILTEPLSDHIAKRFQRPVLLVPEPQKPVINAVLGQFHQVTAFQKSAEREAASTISAPPKWLLTDRERVQQRLISRCHALIDAVSLAFGEHRPLVLSPDCIWLTIEQGFAHHLTENAETLRHRLVKHQGKGTLSANVFDLSLKSFEGAIAEFSSQIRDASDTVLHETLICNFSTTTPTIRTASEVVLMDAYSSYFSYEMRFVCGIPKITVTGSTEDWQRIRSRVEVLATYGLEWWAIRLRPILDEFVRTANGQPDLEFWQAICKPKRAYGATTITGWVADLFPYLNDRPNRRRSHVFEHKRRNWAIPVETGIETRRSLGGEPGAEKGVATASFPSGLASVPVKLSFPNGSAKELDFVAGFVGVEQSPNDLALSPVISWSVTERAPSKPVVI
jgi:hypothetical protein